MRWLLLLIGLHLSAGPFDQVHPSTPDEIASLRADLLVDGFVSAISGQIALSETDLHITQDISFEKRNSRPDPDIRAEGNPHTIIQIPGPSGSYTTHNGDGTWKQYRGSGKPHGGIPRPNIKETKNNPSPIGPKPGKPTVREATPNEIPGEK